MENLMKKETRAYSSGDEETAGRSEEAAAKLKKMLDLLVHVSQCRCAHCQYPNRRKMNWLFHHAIQCKTRATGGCVLCKKMWYLLQLHARACKESECHVPRCRDLKEHLKKKALRAYCKNVKPSSPRKKDSSNYEKQLKERRDLLVHAVQCRCVHCQYPKCRKVKGLFRHGSQCKTRSSGGCVICKKMWHILQHHAQACKESECHVPRCRDLKEHLKKLALRAT